MSRWAAVVLLSVAVVLGVWAATSRGPDDAVAVGPPGAVTAEWVDGDPVWVVHDEDAGVVVLDAVNPHPWNGMDELVGWCERSGWFEAWWDRSMFDAGGRYIFGPAPHDLPRYDVAETLQDGRVRLGNMVVPPDRSHSDDEPDGPSCDGDGGGGSGHFPPQRASYHPVEGSGREPFEGALVAGADGVARFCADPGVPPSCPEGSPTVPQVGDLRDRVMRGSFLARDDDGVLRDVIYLPEG